MHVLLGDDLSGLTLRRVRPWHRMLARGLAARLDGQLAGGIRPEASAVLAARAVRLTSMSYRRDLAASLRAILSAAGHPEPARRRELTLRPQRVPRPQLTRRPERARRPERVPRPQPAGARLVQPGIPGETPASAGIGPMPPPATQRSPGTPRQPRVAVCRGRISRSAAELAELARRLAEPGPLPAQGVAIVSRLLADGRGPLYRAASREDLGLIFERAARSLAV